MSALFYLLASIEAIGWGATLYGLHIRDDGLFKWGFVCIFIPMLLL